MQNFLHRRAAEVFCRFCFCVMKERINKAAVVYAAAAVMGIAAAAAIKLTGRGIPCIFRIITGLKCPGCGNTTAVLALLELDFMCALAANPLFPAEFAYIGWAAICYTAEYVKTGKKQLMPKPEWLNWCFLGVLILWTIIRNIIKI